MSDDNVGIVVANPATPMSSLADAVTNPAAPMPSLADGIIVTTANAEKFTNTTATTTATTTNTTVLGIEPGTARRRNPGL
jgi:hypothetical protein